MRTEVNVDFSYLKSVSAIQSRFTRRSRWARRSAHILYVFLLEYNKFEFKNQFPLHSILRITAFKGK